MRFDLFSSHHYKAFRHVETLFILGRHLVPSKYGIRQPAHDWRIPQTNSRPAWYKVSTCRKTLITNIKTLMPARSAPGAGSRPARAAKPPHFDGPAQTADGEERCLKPQGDGSGGANQAGEKRRYDPNWFGLIFNEGSFVSKITLFTSQGDGNRGASQAGETS